MKKDIKLFDKQYLAYYAMIFYLVSIILDLHIFYNSISTLIRVIIINILFFIVLFKYSNKKERKRLLVYFLILGIYIVFHILHLNTFNVKIIPIRKYSTIEELLYFLKTSTNVLFIYTIYKLNINKKNFYRLISISALVISLTIIIGSLFKIGYTSYDFNKVNYSILDWFKIEKIDFFTASSKGFFHLTNQIAATLILYLPILLIYLKEKIKVSNIINIFLVITSLFILGTRISTYSTFIILGVCIIGYIITAIVEKKVKLHYILIISIFICYSALLYSSCPLLSRNDYYNRLFHPEIKEVKVLEKAQRVGIKNLTDKEFKLYLGNFNIVPDFYNTHYPLEKDRAFYENYLSLNTPKINDTRFLEEEIIKRVKELNNNKMDSYLGMGYSRVINIFNIEKDYVMQYYSLGIIGAILVLGVYIVLTLYMFFKMLFNLKRYFNYENIILLFSIAYFLLSAYFTGNVLNAISSIIPISFVIGFLISYLKSQDKKTDYEYYLGFKTSLMDINKISKEVFKEDKQVVIYNINPLICVNFRNNKSIKEEFNKESYNIPDGNGIVLSAKLTSNNLNKSIPGIELMEKICEESIKNNYSIYLYGAKEDSVTKTKEKLEKKYKGINIVGYSNGYIDEKKALKEIKKARPDILFVALGSPKQEEFIINNRNKLKSTKIIMPVGGSFDVISGNLKRAPEIYRKLKIEWLYRMLKEPKRFKHIFELAQYLLLALFGNF